jgi:hypothetical protein
MRGGISVEKEKEKERDAASREGEATGGVAKAADWSRTDGGAKVREGRGTSSAAETVEETAACGSRRDSAAQVAEETGIDGTAVDANATDANAVDATALDETAGGNSHQKGRHQ